MRFLPQKVEIPGHPELTQLLTDILTKLRFQKLMPGKGYLVKESANGTTIQVNLTPGGGGGLMGPYQLQSVEGDYVTAFAYDPVTETTINSIPVNIAKEPKHWQSLDGETIFGVDHSYTYIPGTTPPTGYSPGDINNAFRADTYNGVVEYQRITPAWVCSSETVDGELIFAEPANTGVKNDQHNPVTLIIAKRSCQWAQVLLPTS